MIAIVVNPNNPSTMAWACRGQPELRAHHRYKIVKLYANILTYIHTCTYIHASVHYMHMYICVYTYIYMCICVYIYVYIRVCMCVCVCLVYRLICIYIYDGMSVMRPHCSHSQMLLARSFRSAQPSAAEGSQAAPCLCQAPPCVCETLPFHYHCYACDIYIYIYMVSPPQDPHLRCFCSFLLTPADLASVAMC